MGGEPSRSHGMYYADLVFKRKAGRSSRDEWRRTSSTKYVEVRQGEGNEAIRLNTKSALDALPSVVPLVG